MTIKVAAVAWLNESDWPRWRKIDAQLPSYEGWLDKINRLIAQYEAGGLACRKVVVDPDIFAKWCRDRGLPIDRNVRARYAAEQLMARVSDAACG